MSPCHCVFFRKFVIQNIYDFEIDKSADFDKIQVKESPAVSGRSKSGDAAVVALLSKGYGNIALDNFMRHVDCSAFP